MKKTCKTETGTFSVIRYWPRRKFAQVIDLRTHATERQLYLWFADGKSGYWDMSDIDPEPYTSWDDDTFANWKVDAGMPCWGEDRHFSPDWAAKELVRMPYHKWLMSQEPEDDIAFQDEEEHLSEDSRGKTANAAGFGVYLLLTLFIVAVSIPYGYWPGIAGGILAAGLSFYGLISRHTMVFPSHISSERYRELQAPATELLVR